MKRDIRLVSNVAEVAISALKAGCGIAVAAAGIFAEELRSGELIRLLGDWTLPEVEVHALFPGGKAGKPAARALVDHLLAVKAARDLPGVEQQGRS